MRERLSGQEGNLCDRQIDSSGPCHCASRLGGPKFRGPRPAQPYEALRRLASRKIQHLVGESTDLGETVSTKRSGIWRFGFERPEPMDCGTNDGLRLVLCSRKSCRGPTLNLLAMGFPRVFFWLGKSLRLRRQRPGTADQRGLRKSISGGLKDEDRPALGNEMSIGSAELSTEHECCSCLVPCVRSHRGPDT